MAWTIATIIIGVLMSAVLLYYVMSLAAKSVDRAHVDPPYRRRSLVLVGVLYVVFGMVVIAEVVAGKEPVQALFGLPIGATIAWFFIRSGIKTKLPKRCLRSRTNDSRTGKNTGERFQYASVPRVAISLV